MDSHCQTKNLVIVYQKLFNVALKKYKTQHKNKEQLEKVNVRACSSLSSFKKLLIDNPKIRHKMAEMCQSGEMLMILLKWKGKYSNLAIAIKYYNVLVNLVINPQRVLNWKNITKSADEEELKNPQPYQNKISQVQTEAVTVPNLELNYSNYDTVVHPLGLRDIFMQQTGSANIFPSEWANMFHNHQFPDTLQQRSISNDSNVSFVPCFSRTRSQNRSMNGK